MRLSDAIRLGAMLKPQAFGRAFDGLGTCAVGAAMDAVGGLKSRSFADIGAQYGWDVERTQEAPCPACGSSWIDRDRTLPHLNDQHRWTRERIADWVQTVEDRDAAAPATLASAPVAVIA